MDDLLDGYIPTQLEIHRMAPDIDPVDQEMVKSFLKAFENTRFDHTWSWGLNRFSLSDLQNLAKYLKKRGWRVHANYRYKFLETDPRLIVYPRGFWGGVKYHLFRWFE